MGFSSMGKTLLKNNARLRKRHRKGLDHLLDNPEIPLNHLPAFHKKKERKGPVQRNERYHNPELKEGIILLLIGLNIVCILMALLGVL